MGYVRCKPKSGILVLNPGAASVSSYRRSPALSRAFVRRKHCAAGDVSYSTTYYKNHPQSGARATRRCVCFISLSILPICKPNFARISWRRRKTRREYRAYIYMYEQMCEYADMLLSFRLSFSCWYTVLRYEICIVENTQTTARVC